MRPLPNRRTCGGVLKRTDQGPLLWIEGRVFNVASMRLERRFGTVNGELKHALVSGPEAERIFYSLWSVYSENGEDAERSYAWYDHIIDGRGVSCRRP